MNRKLRRAVRAGVGTLVHPVPDAVLLAGGPMDGWVVKPGAPALREDWWESWPAGIAATWTPGRYVLEPMAKPGRATWTPVDSYR